MRNIFFFLLAFVAGFSSHETLAQTITDHASVGPAAAWVQAQQPASGDFALSKDLNVTYRLVDFQTRIDPTNTESYARYVESLHTADGVEDYANIKINFDPAYQKVVMHQVLVIRDGKQHDRLSLADFDIYRVETDRDRLMYNKELQLALIIPDVRVGDTIDYAYTIVGRNPAFGPHYVDYMSQAYSVPVQRLHYRTLIDDALPVEVVSRVDAPMPVESSLPGWRLFHWQGDNIAGVRVDDNRPRWHYSLPQVELVSYRDWADVARFFAPAYQAPMSIPANVQAVADEIATQFKDPKLQARAALDYVQQHIRYLGIEFGEGGFIPRAPEQVLSRRFGDCKDMTLLLMTILKALEIEAAALWVDNGLRGAVDTMTPSYGVFDHVIARVMVDGQAYYLDATRGVQLGDLDHLEQGNFGKGLLLAADSPGLIDVAPKSHEWAKDIVDIFDIVSDPGKVGFSTEYNYYGGEADRFMDWIRREGLADVEEYFLKYYQDEYPTIIAAGPMEMTVDESMGHLKLVASYEIPQAWQADSDKQMVYWSARPDELSADFLKYTGKQRTSPYRIAHPLKTRHTQKFVLDEEWNITEEGNAIDNDSFSYSKTSRFEGGVHTEIYAYRTKSDVIPAGTFQATMKEIEEARDDLGITLQKPVVDADAASDGSISDEDVDIFDIVFVFWLLAVLVVSVIYLARTKDWDHEWRRDSIGFPVRLTKYIFMTIVTLGLYQLYWFYKNWTWIRTVQGEELSAFWRTFFAIFMNFSLFRRIGNMGENGLRWFPKISGLLAFLYLVGNSLSGLSTETTTGWIVYGIGVLFMLLTPVPAILHLNRLNADRPDIIGRHSEYRWPVIVLLACTMPFWLLVIIGLVIA